MEGRKSINRTAFFMGDGVGRRLPARTAPKRHSRLKPILGGFKNAHIGGGSQRGGVSGKFGLGTSNQRGENLLNWCEANGLCHVIDNSFFDHRRRGTWFSNFTSRWYELDGFLMKNRPRHLHARKISTVDDASLSDHKPKKLRLGKGRMRWRKPFGRKRAPMIKWEALANEEVA